MPSHHALLALALMSAFLLASSAGAARKHTLKVETITASSEPVASTHSGSGWLYHQQLVRIYAQEEGRVIRLAGYPGDHVNQGRTLVRLDDRLIVASLKQAEAEQRLATKDLERLRKLKQRKLASEDEIERAKTALKVANARTQLQSTRRSYALIKAPFDGIITQRLVNEGDAVAKHSELMRFADPSSLMARIQVSELVLASLSLGDSVRLSIDALGNQDFAARVARIHPTIDPKTRLGRLDIAFNTIPQAALAGQHVRAQFRSAERPQLLLPQHAIRHDRDGPFVFIIQQDKAQRRAVSLGLRFGERRAITNGLLPGERVVIRGFLGLRNGSHVTDIATLR